MGSRLVFKKGGGPQEFFMKYEVPDDIINHTLVINVEGRRD
jgi:hypothetical protein